MKKQKRAGAKKEPEVSEKTTHTEDAASPTSTFPIVGIGASAGGLGAFETFFSGMPRDTEPGMAFVLVQHLAPDHKSILTELVSRYTRMKVYEVEDGMIVKPNCTYIIPPGYDMAFWNGNLQLFKPSAPHGQRLPIDFLFRSLAEGQGERAIGIVLSGTGSDGTLGARAIKGEGGMVMVQTPESSEYDGMPRSVIATGLADYELPPDEMAPALIAYSSHASINNKSVDPGAAPDFEKALKKIFVLVRAHTGHDFSSYKVSTMRRRVERRMAVHQIHSIEDYLSHLQKSNDEIDALFKDLLIGVTNFFRDTDAFESLKETVIPKLFSGKSTGSLVRVWSAGCSTGEEAYSIAMLLQEHMESEKLNFIGQVFATDIDPLAIATARAGIYPASIATDITTERLERFFTSVSNGPVSEAHSYSVNKSIRDMLIFSEQNVIKDPPFSKLDLISCRNLMIYLSSDLQKKLIPLFHYALKPDGFLFLGTSESVGEFTNLFELIDRKSKLYKRKTNTLSTRYLPAGDFFPAVSRTKSLSQEPDVKKSKKTTVSLRELAEQTLLKQLAPASALVNDQGDIFYLHGRSGRYLEPAEGTVVGYNIIKMAREGLRHGLTETLDKAVKSKGVVNGPRMSVKTNGSLTSVNLTICPVDTADKDSRTEEQLYLVIIKEAKPRESAPVGQDPSQSGDTSGEHAQNGTEKDYESIIASLKDEIRAKEDYIKAATEELETSNEELKSSNEEMQSVNEELQSTNEELETSKEELQSVNEELSTVNNELSAKVADLSRANNDMNNLLAGTGIATIFVDHQLQILRFTPTASELINLIHSDIGRPVNHILTNLLDYTNLLGDVQSVLDTLMPKSIEVQTIKGDWYEMTITPYRTLDNVIEGAVITFVDITEAFHLKRELQTQLSEKVALLKEVHHRVKNNIANIESLLSLQAYSSTNEEVITALQDSIARVKSMRTLYDRLLVSEDYREISIKDYAESLIESLGDVFFREKNITIEKQISDFTIASTKAIHVGMIINEFMTNVFKYAFKDADSGTVRVSIEKSENLVTLTVHDNGVGFDENKDLAKSPGFGLTIVNMLVDQLKGTYSIVNDNGMKSVVQFKL